MGFRDLRIALSGDLIRLESKKPPDSKENVPRTRDEGRANNQSKRIHAEVPVFGSRTARRLDAFHATGQQSNLERYAHIVSTGAFALALAVLTVQPYMLEPTRTKVLPAR